MPQDKTEIENSKIASDASFSRESNLKTFCFYLSKLNFDIEKHIGKSLAFDIYQFKTNSIKKYRDPCVTLPSYVKV